MLHLPHGREHAGMDTINLWQPWALDPASFRALSLLRFDDAALAPNLGKPPPRTRTAIRDGVAVVDIVGVLARRPAPLLELLGWTSTEAIRDDVQAVAERADVRVVVLNIDSPGGTVDGTQALADTVRAVRGRKPIVAYTDGMMASAAYWIGSAADSVYVGSRTAQIGSIGVVSTHVDRSNADAKAGLHVTEIVAGRFKASASPHAPLSDAGKDTLQAHVDYLYGVFVDAVAAHRGTTESAVHQRMADGRIFIGQQALDAGLADGFATLDQVVGCGGRPEGGPRLPQRAAAPTGDYAVDLANTLRALGVTPRLRYC